MESLWREIFVQEHTRTCVLLLTPVYSFLSMSLEPSRCLKLPHWDSLSISAKSTPHFHELVVACFTLGRTWCFPVTFHYFDTFVLQETNLFVPLHTFRNPARSVLTVFRHMEHLAHGTSCLWHIRVQLYLAIPISVHSISAGSWFPYLTQEVTVALVKC